MLDLKELRMERMLSQKQLAELINVERSTITQIELGVNKPSVKTAMALGKYFNVDWRKFYEEAEETN